MDKEKYMSSIANFINKSDKLGYLCRSSLDIYGTWHAKVYYDMTCVAKINSNFSMGTHHCLDVSMLSKSEQKTIKLLLNNLIKFESHPVFQNCK